MAYLMDSNVPLRMAERSDPWGVIADTAICRLEQAGERVHTTPQTFTEFRSVATRSKSQNGLGLTAAEADAAVDQLEADYPMLPDTPDIHVIWKRLVKAAGTVGKQVHDARLVAVCHAHGITHLLTYYTDDFNTLATIPPGVVIVHPADV